MGLGRVVYYVEFVGILEYVLVWLFLLIMLSEWILNCISYLRR